MLSFTKMWFLGINMNNKLIYGFGINDADYVVQIRETLSGTGNLRKRKLVWMCPYYSRWVGMIKRGFSRRLKSKHKTYEHVSVCEEWKYFSSFRAWMETQNWEGLHLDNDILIKDNKVYSQDTCAFVPMHVNMLLTKADGSRGKLPIGVGYKTKHKLMVNELKKPYFSRVSSDNKRKLLGYFETPDLAHKAWQLGKAIEIEKVIDWYAGQDCFRTDVAEALTQRVWQLRLDHVTDVETKDY